ncbi:MAG: hypothetical protein LBJ48_00125 [Coriobacteriales bacterium]|nr:hypothetical protein [Coriobacteriales bacterium]
MTAVLTAVAAVPYDPMQEVWDVMASIGRWVLGILAILVIMNVVYSIVNTINKGKKVEATLSTRFMEVQNQLADCMFRIRSIGSITNSEAAFLETIMHEAISGRYGEGQGANAFILAENYPELAGASVPFERIAEAINGSMADFRRQQSSLLSQLEQFEHWRTGTLLSRIVIGNRYPDRDLIARIGNNTYYGPEALEQMYRIVHTSESLQAYNEAILTPYDHNGYALDAGLD